MTDATTPKRGRPRLPFETARRVRVAIVCSPSEVQSIDALASVLGVGRSEAIRIAVRTALEDRHEEERDDTDG